MDKGTYNARKLYYKKWRAKNKDKITQYNRQYWERREKREQMQERDKSEHGSNKTISDT